MKMEKSFGKDAFGKMTLAGGIVLLMALSIGIVALGSAQSLSWSASPVAGKINPIRNVDQPNVLFIVLDDFSPTDMDQKLPNGQYVMKFARTLIGQNGTTFTNGYTTTPLCCPARATMLTGQFVHNHGVATNDAPNGGFAKFNDSSTLPIWLQQAGYYTSHAGKYLNGYQGTYVPPGWDDWFTQVMPGVVNYYNYYLNDDGTLVHYGNTPSDYLTDVVTGHVMQTLNLKPFGDKPWFIKLDYFAPHNYMNAPTPAPRHVGLMTGTPVSLTPDFNEQDVSDKPVNVQSLPFLDDLDYTTIQNAYWRRMETLMGADEGIARIIQKLKDTGEYDDTVIIFIGDNGWMYGDHRSFLGKWFPYERSIGVPFMMSGKNVPAGVVNDKLVANVDISPTILEWANATPGLPQDGRSLVPLLQNPNVAWREDLLIESPVLFKYHGLRTQDALGHEYMFMTYDYNSDGILDDLELYALTPDSIMVNGDPYEMESQHANPAYATLIQQFIARVNQLKTCVGVQCQ
jgi:arylsulfatase A-like enzyme